MALNPHQRNKVDMSALTEDEQKAFRMYGKLPNRKEILQNKLKERKYFDSGDYALSKAGKSSDISPTDVGREHPIPENIPHLSSSPSASGSAISPHPGHERGSISAASTSATGGPSFAPSSAAQGVHGGSPVKDPSWLQREESIDAQPGEEAAAEDSDAKGAGVPIRGRPGGL